MILKQVPTSDFTKGRKSYEFIVMHWGVTNTLAQIDAEVLNPNRQMSYHYAIDNDEVHQYVQEENTAWHASVFDVNQRSIGICINASPTNPYSEQDYITAAELIREILKRHPGMQIKGHRDFHATQCPGPLDFNKLNNLIGGDMPLPREDYEGEIYKFPQFNTDMVFLHLKNPPVADRVAPGWGGLIQNATIPPEIKEAEKETIVYKDSPETLKKLSEQGGTIDALNEEIKDMTLEEQKQEKEFEKKKVEYMGTIGDLTKELEKEKNYIMIPKDIFKKIYEAILKVIAQVIKKKVGK